MQRKALRTRIESLNTTSDYPGARLRVWSTSTALEDLSYALASELTLDGERLVVIDAAGCFDPSQVGRSAVPVATNLRVVRATDTAQLQTALWTVMQGIGEPGQPRRVLMNGVLEPLYGMDLLTRDAARVLGRMKLAIQAMVDSGMDVIVACRAGSPALSVRSYLLSSLCAFADEVHLFPVDSAPQQHVDSPSAAIA